MIKEKLLNDLKEAMKDKNLVRKNTVQMVRAAVLQVEKDKQIELTDEQVIEIIAKEAKKRKDAEIEFEKSGREDLIKQNKEEIEILTEYLPKQLSSEEIDAIIDNVFKKVNPTSPKDMGAIMKEATPLLKGKADMKEVSNKIKDRINSL